mmetsp:Transcript_18256/g.33763  ORF Transcript_18256/g.33763 Transcript_18256/m.33763 type:complete len:434 (+) Transcript_18256:162-1463(+)
MCSNKKQRLSSQAANQARLEVTCEPEQTTFRDEGGKFNYLFAYIVLRTGSNGLPSTLQGQRSIPIECSLEYEDESVIPCSDSKPSLKLFGSAGVDQVSKEETPMFDCQKLCGSVRYRILKLSRNHDARRFIVKFSLAGVSESVVQPVVTRPTLVLSKRKWLRAEERTPEIDARKAVELQGARENFTLANESQRAHAQANYTVPIRQLASMENLESSYPIHKSLHDHDTVSMTDMSESHSPEDDHSISTHGDGSDDCDEDYKPGGRSKYSRPRHYSRNPRPVRTSRVLSSRRTAISGTSTTSFSSVDSEMFNSMLEQVDKLQSQMKNYQDIVHRIESENNSLKRKVQELEGRVSVSEKISPVKEDLFWNKEEPQERNINDNVPEYIPPNTKRNSVVHCAKLSLPRLHSLGIVGEEFATEMMAELDTTAIFSHPM